MDVPLALDPAATGNEAQLLLLALLAYHKEAGREQERVTRNYHRLSSDDHRWLTSVCEEGREWDLAQSIEAGVAVNQAFFNLLVRHRQLVPEFQITSFPESVLPEDLVTSSSRVRQLLSALAREWTSDGAKERAEAFQPLIQAISELGPCDVLIPGASLGRLAHEVAAAGHRVTAIEVDLLKRLAYLAIREISPLSICPYILNTCNRRNPQDHAVPLTVADNPELLKFPIDFVLDDVFAWAAEFGADRKFDAIMTSSFIDACDTPIGSLSKIFSLLLKPNGVWVNCGGLAYSYEGGVSRRGESATSSDVYEASAEEILVTLGKCGFEVVEHKFVKTSFCANPRSLMYSEIEALFFVAKKL